MGLIAAQAAFSGECDEWLVELREYLTANRDFMVGYVREHLPEVRVTVPNATCLAWLDFSEFVRSGRIQDSPYEYFLREARVAVSDGKIFGPGHEGFIRLNFGCPRGTLEEGLERIRKSLYR
jgi:cystathionine beta-lyase